MDWSRYPLEKLFSFVAAVIPGFVALLVFSGSMQQLFALGSLGYRTRVAVVVLVAFVVGFTMTTTLNALLGAIGGSIGSVSYKPPHTHPIAPWRDPRWRRLVKNQ